MYKPCTTQRAAEQQLCFEETLLELMLEQSYASITVKMLCEKAGLSRMTFYRLFESKEDVLYALVDHVLQNLVDYKLPQCQIESGASPYLQKVFSYWRQQSPLIKALFDNHFSALFMERSTLHILREDTDTLQYIGAANNRYEREMLQFFLSGILGLINYWHYTGYRLSVLEMAKITEELLTTPPLRLPLKEE